MKRVIIWLMFLLNISALHSQETIEPLENMYRSEPPYKNVYYKDLTGYLAKYIGTWEYSDTSIYFKVQFYKLNHVKGSFGLFETIFEDELRSFILYKVVENGNWVTKYNTFAIIFNNDEVANQNSIRGNLKGINDNNLILSYTEPSISCMRVKTASLFLKYSELSGVEKLEWIRKPGTDNRLDEDGLCPDGTPIDESDFIIPTNMILTKVN